MSDWKERERKHIIEGIIAYYEQRRDIDPTMTLLGIDQELDSQFLRLGNDWTGRGIVMDTVITATIDALQIVRCSILAKCPENPDKQ